MFSLKKEEREPADINKYLINRGYSPEQVETLLEKDVLIFPSNQETIVTDKEGKYELLNPETVVITKKLDREINAELITDQRLEHRYIEHLSADIVLPFIIIFGTDVWEIVKGIISNWLYGKIKGLSKGGKKPSARFEYEIQDDKKKIRRHIVYEGPAEELADILKETKD